MNGETTVPWVIMINPPKISINIIMGASQSFFLTNKNSISSLNISTSNPFNIVF